MKRNQFLLYVLAFVLGYLVSRMMGGHLIEGSMFDSIVHDVDNYVNPFDGTDKRGTPCHNDDDCKGTCGRFITQGQEKCFKKGTIQGICRSGDECVCVCDGDDDDYEDKNTVVF